MLWTDAEYSNRNKCCMASGEIWLGTCILTAYVLSNILMSKMIYYYFICRSKMKKKKRFSWSYPRVELCSNLQNDGLRKEECFSFSEVIKHCARPMIYKERCLYFLVASLWMWSLSSPLKPCVDNQLAKADSELVRIRPGVTSFSRSFVHI